MRAWPILTSLALFAGCHSGNGAGVGGDLVMSNQPRLAAADVPAGDVATQSQDNADFAFQLYAQLATTPGNLFFSPYSVSSALGMTWAGAAHDTATQMATALRFTLPKAQTLDAFNAIDAALDSRAQMGTAEGGGPFKLGVVNAIWAQQALTLQTPFLDALGQNFGAGVRLEDFATAPDAARADINAWVSDNTAGKIPMLLAQGTVSQQTRIIVTNAVYFNGAWASPFAVSSTQPAPFHALDGSTPSVSMMHQLLTTGYAAGDGWQAVELGYSNAALTLTVIVPDAGQLAAVEGQLSRAFLTSVIAAEQPYQVTLGLPKFSARTQASLQQPLQALGMTDVFSGSADFSGIDGRPDLRISDVVHQATVHVDEAGTEAAAATAVILAGNGSVSVPPPPVTLTVDRPFLIVLRDVPTGAVLFVGRISQP